MVLKHRQTLEVYQYFLVARGKSNYETLGKPCPAEKSALFVRLLEMGKKLNYSPDIAGLRRH